MEDFDKAYSWLCEDFSNLPFDQFTIVQSQVRSEMLYDINYSYKQLQQENEQLKQELQEEKKIARIR